MEDRLKLFVEQSIIDYYDLLYELYFDKVKDSISIQNIIDSSKETWTDPCILIWELIYEHYINDDKSPERLAWYIDAMKEISNIIN